MISYCHFRMQWFT